jgi:ubiquinone/menaquinone biosynthesis C-methylase UbiE
MVDYYAIYQQQAAAYHAMITAEDYQHHLRDALLALLPRRKTGLLDLGSGTGRLPRILKDEFNQIAALDLHRPMLQQQPRGTNLQLLQADMRFLPIPSHNWDVVSAGWAIGHLCGWYPQTWRQEVKQVLQEMHRTVILGGLLVIMETMSTGEAQPAPPVPWLAEFYAWLEGEWGFAHQTIATDYCFPSPQAAVEAMGFFFGETLTQKIERYQWCRVPEWTGI